MNKTIALPYDIQDRQSHNVDGEMGTIERVHMRVILFKPQGLPRMGLAEEQE